MKRRGGERERERKREKGLIRRGEGKKIKGEEKWK